MNYSAIILIALVAYLWHTGSLFDELQALKQLLIATYEMIERQFNNLAIDLALIKNETTGMLVRLQNATAHTIRLVADNGRKIDSLNTKIDNILQEHRRNYY
ncbi:gp16 [Orgyia leucostigma nucleopolyhedrovirus]|uniref:Gp16 n=1 Tax=Orgyia leucostigma nucleopolyhedrovirus TaxID=490711 RepID=B0FDY6_9ABAC|nr:gp16 [Orgyia leucostigma nucleopolyhedrovirus]ABY65844.1 gp16 [Orgyia leucostigma nucleopolyhedrovirus]